MTFTLNSDLYVAVQDAGINRSPAPCYGTATVSFQLRVSLTRNRPSASLPGHRRDPCSCTGTESSDYRNGSAPGHPDPHQVLDYLVQLDYGGNGLFPGEYLYPPSGADPPLANQNFAVHFGVCAGLICQPRVRVWPPVRDSRRKKAGDIDCFCLDLFVTGGCNDCRTTRVTSSSG